MSISKRIADKAEEEYWYSDDATGATGIDIQPDELEELIRLELLAQGVDNIDKIVEMASDCHDYSDDAGKKRIDISPDQLKELLRAFLEPCKLEYNVYDKEDWLSRK